VILVIKAIVMGLFLAFLSTLTMEFLAAVLGVPTKPNIAGVLEGIAFLSGFVLGVYIVSKKPPSTSVKVDDWGKRP
jgi:hypothetical protein